MIHTEQTPNPESLKFLSENVISAIGTEEFQKSEINKITNPFIKELLGFKGIELVLLSKNFLSVKKTKERTNIERWSGAMQIRIFGSILAQM